MLRSGREPGQGTLDLGVAVPGGRQLGDAPLSGYEGVVVSRREPCALRSRERLPAGPPRLWNATSDGDGDLSLCAAAFQVAYGLGHFG